MRITAPNSGLSGFDTPRPNSRYTWTLDTCRKLFQWKIKENED